MGLLEKAGKARKSEKSVSKQPILKQTPKQNAVNVAGSKAESLKPRGLLANAKSLKAALKKEAGSAAAAQQFGTVYSTFLDNIYERIISGSGVSLQQLADEFHVDKDELEQWLSILGRENVISLHYPIVGEPVAGKFTGEAAVVHEGKNKKMLGALAAVIVVLAIVAAWRLKLI